MYYEIQFIRYVFNARSFKSIIGKLFICTYSKITRSTHVIILNYLVCIVTYVIYILISRMCFYWTALAVKIPNANERLPRRCRAFEVYRNLPSQAAMLPSYLIRACVALLDARFFFLFSLSFILVLTTTILPSKAAVTKSWAFLRAAYLLYYLNNNNLRFIFNALRILFCDNYRLPIFSNRYREIHVYISLWFFIVSPYLVR